MSANAYKENGQYVLEMLELQFLENGFSKVIDLSNQLISLNLFESMEHGTMSGNLSIIDVFDLPNILSLYGNETIRMIFYTAGNIANPIQYEGKVYKLSPKRRITEHSSGYTIYFQSDAALRSDRQFVQRGYIDINSNIATDIFESFMRGGSTKPFITTSTKRISNYCFGAIKPLEALAVLQKQSVSVADDHSYVFYENNKEFVFKPLQELFKSEPVATYYYGVGSVFQNVYNRHEESFEKIQSVNFIDDNSFIDRIMDGIHGSKHIMYDLFTKTLLQGKEVDYDKSSWFKDDKSLGKYPNKNIVGVGDDAISLIYGTSVDDLLFHKNSIESKMKRIELETFKCEIEVFGDSNLKCGDVINCYIPNLNLDQNNIKNEFSGKVLITGINHMITSNKYHQSILIQKDAYEDIK